MLRRVGALSSKKAVTTLNLSSISKEKFLTRYFSKIMVLWIKSNSNSEKDKCLLESQSRLLRQLEKSSEKDLLKFVQDNSQIVKVDQKDLDYIGFLILLIQSELNRNQAINKNELILRRIFVVSLFLFQIM